MAGETDFGTCQAGRISLSTRQSQSFAFTVPLVSKKKHHSSIKPNVAWDPLRQGIFLAGVYFFVAIALLAASTIVFWQTRDFVRSSISVPGRVVDLERSVSSDRYTVFTFTNEAGQTYTARTRFASKRPIHQIGEPITVLYSPTQPQAARIKSFDSLWLFPTFIGAFAIVFTGAGTFAFIAARKTYGGSQQGRVLQSDNL